MAKKEKKVQTKKEERYLLAALGTGNYQKTCYQLRKQESRTKFSFVALEEMFHFQRTYLMVTKKADEKFGREVKELMGEKVTFISIPDGLTKEEIWQIFDLVEKKIPANSSISVDITHGFRSIPFILSLICFYLQASKGIEIDNIYYGAYDPQKGDTTPLIELKDAFDLVEWFYGVKNFQEYGFMGTIGKLLQRIHQERREDIGADKPITLSKFGNALNGLEEALDMAQPLKIAQKAETLKKILKQSRFELRKWAKPARKIYQTFKTELALLALPSKDRFSKKDIEKQVVLIQWYEGKNRISKAISLAKEVMVNRMLLELGYKKREEWLDNHSIRKKAEDHFWKLEQVKKTFSVEAKKILDLWSNLRDKRNLVNHHGFSRDEQKLSHKKVKETLQTFYCLITASAWKELNNLPPTKGPHPMTTSKKLILLFSHCLTPDQERSAREDLAITQIIALPKDLQCRFSQVPPQLTSLQDYADPLFQWLQEAGEKGDYALIQGDYGLTYLLVNKAMDLGLFPVYATTKRATKEVLGDDGRVKVERVFHHQGFRRYEIISL